MSDCEIKQILKEAKWSLNRFAESLFYDNRSHYNYLNNAFNSLKLSIERSLAKDENNFSQSIESYNDIQNRMSIINSIIDSGHQKKLYSEFNSYLEKIGRILDLNNDQEP